MLNLCGGYEKITFFLRKGNVWFNAVYYSKLSIHYVVKMMISNRESIKYDCGLLHRICFACVELNSENGCKLFQNLV